VIDLSGPEDWLTTIGLASASLGSGLACAAAVVRVRRGLNAAQALSRWIVLGVGIVTAAIFIYRAAWLHHDWVPIDSHVDGLLLLSSLLAMVIAYLQWTERLAGLGMFALPVLALLTLWGVCASWWTLRPFDIGDVWRGVHVLSVYVGAIAIITAAAAGALWLQVDHLLKSRRHGARRLRLLGRLANLESIEGAITLWATGGFILMTLALVTGLVIVTAATTRLGPGWWYSPKVLLASGVWLIFALVMNVRYVSTFRGRRAAVLSIVGFVLLIATFGIAQTLPPTVVDDPTTVLTPTEGPR
jgi:ABC-type uncharacterized transport system permease subunit